MHRILVSFCIILFCCPVSLHTKELALTTGSPLWKIPMSLSHEVTALSATPRLLSDNSGRSGIKEMWTDIFPLKILLFIGIGIACLTEYLAHKRHRQVRKIAQILTYHNQSELSDTATNASGLVHDIDATKAPD